MRRIITLSKTPALLYGSSCMKASTASREGRSIANIIQILRTPASSRNAPPIFISRSWNRRHAGSDTNNDLHTRYRSAYGLMEVVAGGIRVRRARDDPERAKFPAYCIWAL